MIWRLCKTLLFTIFVPGTVAGFIPYLILAHENIQIALPSDRWRWIGIFPFLLGACIYLWCAWDFAVKGLGTPAPLDAPRVLVVKGLYRFVRNPMYVGVGSIILGETVGFGSELLLAYFFTFWLTVHLFVVFYEEPTLRRLFGNQYENYCRRVSRWFPRWKAAA